MADPAAVAVTVALCRQFEGLKLKPYLCPAGIPTIGYGATYYPGGRKVQLTDPEITREYAELMLDVFVEHDYMPAVQKLCPLVVMPNQLGAITDTAYNIGLGRFKASTLRKKINAGNWEAVPAELRKWKRGGGRILAGLVARREAEIAYLA